MTAPAAEGSQGRSPAQPDRCAHPGYQCASALEHQETPCQLDQPASYLAVLVLNLLDVQPPAVLEVLIEEAKLRCTTGPKNRQEVRETLIRYAEDRLREARKSERELYEGLTEPNPESKSASHKITSTPKRV
jgi:hypothetical protein